MAYWGGLHACAAIELILVAVVGHAAACAAKGKCGADDGGQADVFNGVNGKLKARFDVAFAVFHLRCRDDCGFWVFNAKAVHGVTEEAAIFCHFNGFALGANHLDAEFFEHAHVGERKRCVQSSLTAHCGQERVRALFLDDFGDDFGGDGLDVGRIRKARIGHDCRGVGVDEDDAVAFFAQRLTGLCARIVEFAGLPDNNRPRTDNHDRLDIITFWHGRAPYLCACKLSCVIGTGAMGASGIVQFSPKIDASGWHIDARKKEQRQIT